MKNNLPSMVLPIIIINVVVFFFQIFPGVGSFISSQFSLVAFDIFSRPWILLTSMFLHGSPTHLLFNMYAVLIFGPFVEGRIGPKRFLLMYLITGLIAGLGYSMYHILIADNAVAVGASGAVMGIIGTLIVLMPNLRLLLFFAIPMPLWVAGILFAAIDVFGFVTPGGGIANLAHLFGMGAGLLYGFKLRKTKQKFQKKFSSKTNLSDDDVESYLQNGRL